MSYEDDCILYSEEKRDWIMVECPGNAHLLTGQVTNDCLPNCMTTSNIM